MPYISPWSKAKIPASKSRCRKKSRMLSFWAWISLALSTNLAYTRVRTKRPQCRSTTWCRKTLKHLIRRRIGFRFGEIVLNKCYQKRTCAFCTAEICLLCCTPCTFPLYESYIEISWEVRTLCLTFSFRQRGLPPEDDSPCKRIRVRSSILPISVSASRLDKLKMKIQIPATMQSLIHLTRGVPTCEDRHHHDMLDEPVVEKAQPIRRRWRKDSYRYYVR